MKTKRCIALCLTIGIMSFGVVYAEDSVSSTKTQKPTMGMTKDFSSFVTNGIIDQTTADEINTYIQEKLSVREDQKAKPTTTKGKPDFTSSLVTEGIITETQAEAMKELKSVRSKSNLGLDNLVSDGTIDQETADQITAYLAEQQKARQDSKAERKANPTKTSNLFTGLVEAGILTQEQADAMKEAMPQKSEATTKGAYRKGAQTKSLTDSVI